jgi:hypothetical protein
MHGALSREIGKPEASSSENDASTDSCSATERESRIVAEAHRQSSNTALQALGADISDEANYAAHDNFQDLLLIGFLRVMLSKKDTGRESPDLYGATPPRTKTPELIAEELGVANGGSQHDIVVATL